MHFISQIFFQNFVTKECISPISKPVLKPSLKKVKEYGVKELVGARIECKEKPNIKAKKKKR